MQKKPVNKAQIICDIHPSIEKAVLDSELELLEVDFVEEYDKYHLRVYIYNTKHSVTHEDCEKVTSLLSENLDSLIPVPYYLEVSSPGTERKLKSPKEYTIFKGKRVKIKLKKATDDNLKVFFGTIEDYDFDTGLQIKQEDNNSVIIIEENNISSIKLEPKYKY